MEKAVAIIGANFGDEGKGLMTDYFASKVEGKGIVVRFNGGSQAGHTVVTPDGKRHVFRHFGSGTFAGLPTFLGQDFIVNPLTFVKELKELKELGITPEVYISPACLVTTPYDMLINQWVEVLRGDEKHGSCGLGINETAERSTTYNLSLMFFELEEEPYVKSLLKFVRTMHVPKRLHDLGITLERIAAIPKEQWDLINAPEALEDAYSESVLTMFNASTILETSKLTSYDTVIFEGAQGLLLDQSNTKYFPYVTHSNTGMHNVKVIMSNTKSTEVPIEIVYVTRPYLTRHGAGLFPTELPEPPYTGIIDTTNVPNEFQDTIRYGLMDKGQFATAIISDLKDAEGLNSTVKIALTCVNQVGGEDYKYTVNGCNVSTSDLSEFAVDLLRSIGADSCYYSYNPTREDILEGGPYVTDEALQR